VDQKKPFGRLRGPQLKVRQNGSKAGGPVSNALGQEGWVGISKRPNEPVKQRSDAGGAVNKTVVPGIIFPLIAVSRKNPPKKGDTPARKVISQRGKELSREPARY